MYVYSNELFKLKIILCITIIYSILKGIDYSKNSFKNFINININVKLLYLFNESFPCNQIRIASLLLFFTNNNKKCFDLVIDN